MGRQKGGQGIRGRPLRGQQRGRRHRTLLTRPHPWEVPSSGRPTPWDGAGPRLALRARSSTLTFGPSPLPRAWPHQLPLPRALTSPRIPLLWHPKSRCCRECRASGRQDWAVGLGPRAGRWPLFLVSHILNRDATKTGNDKASGESLSDWRPGHRPQGHSRQKDETRAGAPRGKAGEPAGCSVDEGHMQGLPSQGTQAAGVAAPPCPQGPVLTLTCRCCRKCCSRRVLKPKARARSWPFGDLIHGLRC